MKNQKEKMIKNLKYLLNGIENNTIKINLFSHNDKVEGIRDGKPQIVIQYESTN